MQYLALFHQVDRETYEAEYQSSKPTIILAKPAALDSVWFFFIVKLSKNTQQNSGCVYIDIL